MTVSAGERTLTPEEAAMEAGRVWRLRFVSAEALPGDRDENFLLEDEDGARRVLKVAPVDASPDELALETSALAWLADAPDAAELPVPRLVPAPDGALTPTIEDGRGRPRIARLVGHLEGRLLADVRPRAPELLRDLGRTLGRLDRALEGFRPPAERDPAFRWDLRNAGRVMEEHREAVPAGPRRSLVDELLGIFREVEGTLRELPGQAVHGDANDHNVLVGPPGESPTGPPERVTGVIDFGDLLVAPRVCEPAVAAAYALLGEDDPVHAAAAVLAGYHDAFPLPEEQVDLFWPLVLARLGASVCISARRAAGQPADSYHRVSEAPAWETLGRLEAVHPRLGRAAARQACGLEPSAPGSPPGPNIARLLGRRHGVLGPNLSLSYRRPLHVVRGWRQHLYDADGLAYLDCVNNVAHVGHGHPRVVEAAARQMRTLNTNTRYLHELIVRYAERLTALLPDPLEVVYLVNSGSEANELALRMVRAATGRSDVVVLGGAYHGNTGALIDMSPYKHEGAGGRGAPPWVHVAEMPDDYRGRFRRDDPERGRRYAEDVARAVREAEPAGGPAAFFHESLLSCGGQIELPPGYLRDAYRAVRDAGGLCVADEVQVGFGRVGSHFWGFETQGVVPDVVTLGKPIGNGHPLGAVVTTPEVAQAFDTGMEYFNTFGGNPVSCAVGLAVLDVIRDERLRERAARVGAGLREGLTGLQRRHPAVGDARGRGLFLGIELVRDPEARTPDAAVADYLVQRARERGVLLSTDGPDRNVVKIKPPLVFGEEDAARLVALLGELLDEDFVRLRGR